MGGGGARIENKGWIMYSLFDFLYRSLKSTCGLENYSRLIFR